MVVATIWRPNLYDRYGQIGVRTRSPWITNPTRSLQPQTCLCSPTRGFVEEFFKRYLTVGSVMQIPVDEMVIHDYLIMGIPISW